MALLGCAATGVLVLIFDIVLGAMAAVVAGVAAVVLFGSLWALLPLRYRFRRARPGGRIRWPRVRGETGARGAKLAEWRP